MTHFAAIASSADVSGGKFRRFPLYSAGKNVIVFLPGSAKLLRIDEPTPKDVVLIVLAQCLLENEGAVQKLAEREVQGIFLHPSRGDRPGNDAARRVLGAVADCALREELATKLVSFTMEGDEAYRIGELRLVWEWLYGAGDAPVASPPSPALESLRVVYTRFRRRANIEALIPLAVVLQGAIDPEVSAKHREDLLENLTSGGVLRSVEIGQDENWSKFVSAVRGGDETCYRDAAKVVLAQIQELVRHAEGQHGE